jgi:hypothetical protein
LGYEKRFPPKSFLLGSLLIVWSLRLVEGDLWEMEDAEWRDMYQPYMESDSTML